MIFDIQRFSTHDGPGIRTVVFFKGCTLRCAWCENPESQAFESEVLYNPASCIGCHACLDQRFEGLMKLGSEGELSVDRSRPAVAALVETCPSLALRIAGKAASTESLVDELLRDEAFFRSSGGGVTISGGEPLTQPGLALEVARACIARGISVAIETCLAVGEVGIEAFLRLPLLWLADLKHVDGQRFREGTGGELGPVLANLERLAASGADLTLRVPVVPGFNADDASMAAILAYAASLPRGNIASPRRLDLLPYHELAAGKYRMLGRDYPLPRGLAVPEAELQRWAEEGRSLGLEVSLGG